MKAPGIMGCRMAMAPRPMLMEVRRARKWVGAGFFKLGGGTALHSVIGELVL